jgi:hypothetical protein
VNATTTVESLRIAPFHRNKITMSDYDNDGSSREDGFIYIGIDFGTTFVISFLFAWSLQALLTLLADFQA